MSEDRYVPVPTHRELAESALRMAESIAREAIVRGGWKENGVGQPVELLECIANGVIANAHAVLAASER